MVSMALGMELGELYDLLMLIRRKHLGDEEYRQFRNVLPADWPI